MSYTSEILTDPTKLYELLDESSGTSIADSSGNGHTGTLADAVEHTNFEYSQVGPITTDATNLAFFISSSPSTPHIDLGNPADLQITGAITFGCWYKPATPGAWPTSGGIYGLIGKGYDGSHQGYYLRIIDVSGTAKVGIGSYDGVSYGTDWVITDWADGRWRFLVAEYNGTQWVLYVDGVSVAVHSDPFGALSTASNASVGCELLSGSATRVMSGYIARPFVIAGSVGGTRVVAYYNAATGASGPLSAGTLSATSILSTAASLSYVGTSGGTQPYSHQLQKSTTSGSGFSDYGMPQVGATGDFDVTGLSPNTTYYFRVVTTDNVSATDTSAEFSLTTLSTGLGDYLARLRGQFIHFNSATQVTYSSEWGDGTIDPAVFNAGVGAIADPEQWCRVAKASGAGYCVLTATHTDGFALWNTTSSFKSSRDIVAEYVAACRGRGMLVGIYLDFWLRYLGDSWDAGKLGVIEGWLDELLGGAYGTIDIIWIDSWGYVDVSGIGPSFTDLPHATIRDYITGLSPGTIVIVNTHEGTTANSDVAEFENGTVGLNVPSGNTYPAEQCDTITTGYWFYNASASTVLTASQVLAEQSTCNGRNCNLLMNTPPDRASGQIPSGIESVLLTVGGNDVTAPSAPTGLAASAGNTQAALTWTANGEADLDGYDLYQSADNSTYTLVRRVYAYTNPHAGTTVTGLTNGQQYWFKLKAFDHSGNLSGFSSSATATPGAPALLFRRRRAMAAA